MEYTILNIDTEKGHVTFKLADGIVQKVCDFRIDSPESLAQDIVEYAKKYKSPKKVVMASEDAQALIGKTVVVPVEVTPEVVETPVAETIAEAIPVEPVVTVVTEVAPVVEAPVEEVVVETVAEVSAPVEETVAVETPVEAPVADAVDTTASPVEVVNE